MVANSNCQHLALVVIVEKEKKKLRENVVVVVLTGSCLGHQCGDQKRRGENVEYEVYW